MKALQKWVHQMIQPNMIKENKAAHAPPLLVYCCVSHRHTFAHRFYPAASTAPSSMVVCATYPDSWLSSQNQHFL